MGSVTPNGGGSATNFVYNALGQRVEKQAGTGYTELVYDAFGSLIGYHNRTGWDTYFVPFGGCPFVRYQDSKTYFLHPNNLASTTFVTDQTGATVEKTIYYPWGQLWASAGTIHDERFASLEQRDAETDLDPTPFRLYHSRLYRWLSPDPLAGDILNPQSLNRYAYVLNNPTNLTDPLGLSGCTMVWQEVPGGEPIPGLDCTDDTAPTDLPPHPILTPANTESRWYACMSASPYCPNGLYATSPFVVGSGEVPIIVPPPRDNNKSCVSRESLSWATRAMLAALSWAARRSGGVRGIGIGGAGAYAPPSLGGGGASVQAVLLADYMGNQGLYWSVGGGPTAGQAGVGVVAGAQYMTSTFNTTATVYDVVNSFISVGGAAGDVFAAGGDINIQTGVFTETIGFGIGGFGGAAPLSIASGFFPVCRE
jgi:RHS repeat-associated protein